MSDATAGATGAVYLQTNEPRNQVIALRRAADGALSTRGSRATGGAGTGQPHLTSQGSVVVTSSGEHLLVTNAASGDVSMFALRGELELLDRAPAGTGPQSVAERGGLVYVLNRGNPSLTGFRLEAGGLQKIPGSERALSGQDTDPAQVGFAPDSSTLIVTQRGTDSIAAYPVTPEGTLGEPRVTASSGPTPYGFAFTIGGTLVVTQASHGAAGASAASSYVLRGGALVPVSRSVGNDRTALCWVAVAKDGRHAFAVSFGDSAVSRYAVGGDGSLSLEDATAAVVAGGRPGLRDLALAPDGRHLYTIHADSGQIFGFTVADDGTLLPVGSWGDLPVSMAGLAVT
jgi:6-phosphogluconolactonase (cycloisomerase 2 family)